MDFKQIQAIIKDFEKSSITELEIEAVDFKIKLSKSTLNSGIDLEVQEKEVDLDIIEVKSPLVGTLYLTDGKGGEFVSIGSQVSEGDTICIIEAMKIMNEICAPISGTIHEIKIKNEDPVGFRSGFDDNKKMKTQNKILIANRGEIAVRIIRAAKELGIPTVAVYSVADKESLHVKLADEALCIGGAKSADSYLNINNILSAAIATGCNSIHPGYGFLAENDKFVEVIERCNLNFIGPSSETLRLLGDKVMAKQIARSVNIPVIEGSEGIVHDLEEAKRVALKIGYPLLIKAVSGGGGKGICIIRSDDELLKMFDITKLEAEASFGNPDVYLERYIESPHHIEIQFLADRLGNVIYFPERDCSIQRRNQKLLEESPSPFISEELREILGRETVKLAKATNYLNAGTVEFIVDEEKYYFLEVNTRIQVEHPVTEELCGVDLIKEQTRISYFDSLSIKQEDIRRIGHSLECRITAEDPNNNFQPTPGLIKNLVLPGGPGVRIDTHLYNNYEIPPYYDSMLAKLIVWAPSRKLAIRKMRMALEQFIIDGVKTNLEIQYLIMHNTNFVRGLYDTNFIVGFLETLEGEI